jgi:squalene-hopene/tetraprenyl-beta-curcumene cyclase
MIAEPHHHPPLTSELARLTEILLAELGANTHWHGELSSSALATAVAIIALDQVNPSADSKLVGGGLLWLANHRNEDGGWGDTPRGKSNISTTALCWAAFAAARADPRYRKTVAGAEAWLVERAGSLGHLPRAIAHRYGRDRTFSVPILLTLALSGRLGPNGWRLVPALPFELAVLPRALFGALKLPVVSYALPALIAIGQAIHHHAPSRNPIARFVRVLSRARTLRLLSKLQPANGGFLEATPLTAFVTMSMASAGHADHPVTQKGAAFLRSSVRADGSWPIDTNLATWVTTLSIKALSHQTDALSRDQKVSLRAWILGAQSQTIHPYTGAAPGAWAWTDLPGGVPDADDTAGALIALSHLGKPDQPTLKAVEAGVAWLLDLQNSDGGIPTFCLGWGTLQFDRSTPEITAHALLAWARWRAAVQPRLRSRIEAASRRAIRFLQKNQRPDGSFVPLWFGNENVENDENPVYGTSQVLIVLSELSAGGWPIPASISAKAAEFLCRAQHPNGGWGGGEGVLESIEETAVAMEALSSLNGHSPRIDRAVGRLRQLLAGDGWRNAAPVGLYFARLWYYERLYPLIFSIGALGRVNSSKYD